MATWQSSLSFSERMSNIQNLLQAYNSAHHDDAQSFSAAQDVENRAYELETVEEYHRHIRESLERWAALAEKVPPKCELCEVPTTADSQALDAQMMTLGPYGKAVYLQDGISSTVYQARDPDSPSEFVALKLTTPSHQPAPHNSELELRLLRLAAGPNIITLKDSFRQPGGHLVLVFPFLAAPLDVVLRTTALSASRRKDIIRDMLRGLSHLHSVGIIHRDIKPSNILLPSPHSGAAQIIDFGTAWLASDPACEPADAKILDVGTTSYRPPELLFGNQAYDTSLDLWAAGCVAAELLGAWGKKGSSLFEAGDLGSELHLIRSMFETLGTPQEGKGWPDWGKMAFVQYPAKEWTEILPNCEDGGRDFVAGLLRYDSSARMIAAEALEHYFLLDS